MPQHVPADVICYSGASSRQKLGDLDGPKWAMLHLKVVLPQQVDKLTSHVESTHDVAQTGVSTTPVDKVGIAQLVDPS